MMFFSFFLFFVTVGGEQQQKKEGVIALEGFSYTHNKHLYPPLKALLQRLMAPISQPP